MSDSRSLTVRNILPTILLTACAGLATTVGLTPPTPNLSNLSRRVTPWGHTRRSGGHNTFAQRGLIRNPPRPRKRCQRRARR